MSLSNSVLVKTLFCQIQSCTVSTPHHVSLSLSSDNISVVRTAFPGKGLQVRVHLFPHSSFSHMPLSPKPGVERSCGLSDMRAPLEIKQDKETITMYTYVCMYIYIYIYIHIHIHIRT